MNDALHFSYKGFFDHLVDAISFHTSSKDAEKFIVKNRNARSSIVASMFALESAANCLLNSLDLNRKLNDELDRLTLLAKFDVFLKWSGFETLNRGRAEVQSIMEVVRARNDYVHPKVMKLEAKLSPKDSNKDCISFSVMTNTRPSTKISKCPMYWSDIDCLAVLKVTVDFLSYLVEEVMSLAPQEAHKVFSSRIQESDIHIMLLHPELKNELTIAAKDLGISFEFLGVDKSYFIQGLDG
ncbi:hypothetical protein [Marisediminitalea sp.]|uniref:hypothetical protein n=1 Tax=Marisediminitalea sp. TaxID=2662268 RepID=UPI003519CFF9